MRTIVTLDNTSEARDALSLAALEAAGRGDGKLATAARRAHAKYMGLTASGTAHGEAMMAARDVFADRQGRR